MTIIRMIGCSLGDDVYTTDAAILGEEITWNVTRIQRDADAGKFGQPTIVAMSALPPMTDSMRKNVDWQKVRGMLGAHQIDPKTSPLGKPALQVMVDVHGTIYRLPIDGNHRICARRMVGYGTFASFVVPIELEGRYRVMEEIVRG